ncbi:hypothetical protein Misp01_51020 [Microtetraspora sp. NBRC 13810]|uniref:SRPBCC family protein n=1 Tax=Microtetraspora sp. NBRC 13810 TaxID=3030990 RepID=UPI0024A05797|nr:SRPBCC domain-containing protein [Microtetraspora sp. NBRC 13810]GLW09973.1 hypothetical protein Misp01_51020 [Microtetraspora sp. NBRC 13810]
MSEPLIMRARVQAPLKEVFQALTEPAALRAWFAEYAEVELPGRFEFWGRYTLEGDAPHQRLLHADDRSLSFAWLLDGVETTTEIGLDEEAGGATVITLSQSHFDFNDVITGASIRGVLQTFWSLAIANLIDHVEGREITGRIDYTSADLGGEVSIAAPAGEVFDSLIDGEKVSRWFGYPIAIEPYVGGRYAVGGFDNPHAAKIVELEPGHRISIDWGPGGTTVWEVAETGGVTRFTFRQREFDAARPPYASWTGSVCGVAELRRYHELADWQPIWIHDEH